MKRAWTKRVKSLPCAIDTEALERQLQPQPKVKCRIFRTSAAMIGLTVSIGAPNLLLVQAAQVPESISNGLTPIQDSAPETVLLPPATPVPVVVTPNPLSAASTRGIARQLIAKKVVIPTYNPPTLTIQPSALEINSTAETQLSSQVATQTPVVKQDVRALLRQHQLTTALEHQQPATNEVTLSTEANEKAEIAQNQSLETAPTPVTINSSPLEVATSEANSGWTAKQRLLVDKLRNQENPASANKETVQAPISANLAVPATSQPPVELSAPEIGSTEQTLPAPLATETPAVVATGNESMEFEALPLPAEAITLPTAAQDNQNVATTPAEIAQPLPANTAGTPVAPTLQPVFVIPEGVIAQPADAAPIAAAEVDKQVAAQVPKAEATLAKEALPSVNEPIIVTSTTSEYQVKPGDTLTNIASAHRLSLPEIANFNRLQNPDLLLVEQKIKIPSLTSMKTQANVAVLPPIEKVEPLAQANSPTAPALQKPVLTSQASAYTGVGGNVEEAVAEAKPLEQTALDDLQVQYALNLQNDVQKLKHKYYAQNNSNPVVTAQIPKSNRLPAAIKPSSLNDEPINPEFRVAQTFQDLKPIPQKKLVNQADYSAPATVRGRVATAPASADNLEESFTGRQVAPELPPLAPALNYLPQPSNTAPLKGYIWPAKGALTSKYGYRWGRMHRGIDIAAPVGTPIFAAAPGVVIKSGWNKGGYGNLVDIQHADGSLTRYAHNYKLWVQPGQFVTQGQHISDMGSTGRSTGPHLHFEVHPGGKGAVNPIALLPKTR